MTISLNLPEKNVRIIQLLADGLTKKEIAFELQMTPKNVERIIYNMLATFELKNDNALVNWAHQNKVID